MFNLPEPVPVPDLETYQRIIDQRLETNRECRENYARFKARAGYSGEPDYLPIRLDIENVSRCNSRCIMCQVSLWHKGKRAEDMTLDEFKALIDEQYGLVDIKLHGMGEPLMGRDVFFDQIRYARAKGIWVRTVTNASLLHLKDNFKSLVDTDINEIQVSIDGADKETFETIRVGLKFEHVTRNSKMLNDYCAEKGIVRTKMWTMVQEQNKHQLPELVDLAHELGFKHIVFSLDFSNWGQDTWTERHRTIDTVGRFTQETADELVAQGAALGLRVSFWTIADKYSQKTPGRLCPWPFERGYISSDMRVVPCCMLGNPEVSDLGSAQGFTATWTSENFREFRQAHIDGEIPDVCKGCYK